MSAGTVLQPPQARAHQVAHLGDLKFLSVARSDVGCVRKLNEDAVLNCPGHGLWAIADGMGGHEAGEVASAAVVSALSSVADFNSAYAFRHAVCTALKETNAKLTQNIGVCGSTVVALLVYRGHYACVWAGDSRAYLFRDGALHRITRDHTVVQDMVERGALSAEEARAHASAHVITRAVGASENLELDVVHGPVRAGDRFILCSDGLSGMLTDAELAAFVRRPPLESALDNMIAKVLARGAPDNVSAILIGAERTYRTLQSD